MIHKINNFLPSNEAEILYEKIMKTPQHWWKKARIGNDFTSPKMSGDTLEDRVEKERLRRANEKSVQAHKFTYQFTRSTAHVSNCACYECTFKKEMLKSERFKQLLQKCTNLKNPTLGESFTSVYEAGDFLGVHTDEKRGLAFIYNLSKNWAPEYGGMLHIRNEDGSWAAYTPGFNEMVIMQLGETGIPHFVSEVTSFAPTPRLAISGWFNESS
jgi:Rps23 Pro-64 3,4-dihydroxylase Tpa1-like proline 4-hydroxylase